MSDSPGLVDFGFGLVNSVLNLPDGLVNSVLNLPDGQVNFLGEIQITDGL